MAKQPAARWNLPPHLDITGNYGVGIVAFSKDGIANTVFQFNGSGPVIPVSTQGQNPTSGSWEYFLTIPSSVIPSGNYFLGAGAVATDATERVLPTLPVNIWQTTATYTDFYVNADSGNDGGAGSSGDPFLTVKRALEALAGNGNGGRIYLQNATASYSLNVAPSPAPATTTRYLNIELAPGATKANVKIGAWSVATGANKVRFKSLTVNAPLTGAAGTVLLLDDCHLQGTGIAVSIGASGWTPGWGSRYFVDGEVSTSLNGLFAFDMVRGATLTSIGGSAFQSCVYVIDSTATTCGAGLTAISAGSVTNLIWYNVACHDCGAIGLELHPAGAQTLSNSALVNLVVDATGASQIRDYALEHVIVWNCTFPGHTFTLRTDSIIDGSFEECCFRTFSKGPGDFLGEPQLSLLNPIFKDCHHITPDVQPGTSTTTGSAGFTAEGSNDFTPAAGSDLYDAHTATKKVACDAEKVARSNPTTVGALRGADEGGGGGTQPPSGLDYNPSATGILQVIGATGTAITPITPTWLGTITKFEVVPSIYHIYKAPDELPCTPDMAHFEVRLWESGDPTFSGGTHPPYVIEDLRNGHVYIRNPKTGASSTSTKFSAIATAINLASPTASGAGNDGAFPIPDGPPYGTAVIRVRAVVTDLNHGGGGNPLSVYLGGYTNATGTDSYFTEFGAYATGWTAQTADGGFFPIAGVSEGKGLHIKVKIVGATGSKADELLGPISLGGGFKRANGSLDGSYAMGDVLFKDFRFVNSQSGVQVGMFFQTQNKSLRSGRIRLYDYTFRPTASGLGIWGCKQICGIDAGVHYDFRRGVYPPAEEHGNYLQGVNAGLLRDATSGSGETPDSWFIDLVWPQGTGRCLIQFQDRPYDHEVTPISDPYLPKPADKFLVGGKGVVLVERCSNLFGSDAAGFTMQGGSDMTFLFRDVFMEQLGPAGQPAMSFSGEFGQLGAGTKHERVMIVFGWETSGSKTFTTGGPAYSMRLNANGYPVKRAVVIGLNDICDNPANKRMSFRGVEEVHIYSFDCKVPVGFKKATIEIDGSDFGSFQPWYVTQHAIEQVDVDGNITYSQHGGFGTPHPAYGTQQPPCGRVFLYMGYPNNPADYPGWIDSGQNRILGCIYPSAASEHSFSSAEINYYSAVPIDDGFGGLSHIGLTLNPTTGVISGIPTAGIGKGIAGEFLGEPIDSPFTYTTGAPPNYANIPIKGSNAALIGSDADKSWVGDGIQLLIFPLGGGDIFPIAPTANFTMTVGPVTVIQDITRTTPTAEFAFRVGGPGLIVSDAGGPDDVTTPTADHEFLVGPVTVDSSQFINLTATADFSFDFDGAFTGFMLADADGEVLIPGCEDGQVV